MSSITIIILTYNEEIHIRRCLENLSRITSDIVVVDSFSSDRTPEIASSMGARLFQNKWTNHATQFNWALANCRIDTEWTMRLDCDEYLTDELISEIQTKLPAVSEDTGGFIIKRRVIFMNRWIRHGGFYPHRLLRLWRTNAAKLEERLMDEHVILQKGKIEYLEHDFVDHNLNSLSWWINKHNDYATREMQDLSAIGNSSGQRDSIPVALTGEQFSRKRWVKEKVYVKTPLFIRPLCYFFYRYILRFGFLDGKPGLIWHFLQGYWYRFLVDAKIYEKRLKNQQSGY